MVNLHSVRVRDCTFLVGSTGSMSLVPLVASARGSQSGKKRVPTDRVIPA